MSIKSYLPFYRRNMVVAIPVMLSQMGQVMVQQVDNMMVGRVGTTELAAASFANAVFITGMVMGMGFTLGLTPLAGHAFAQKDSKKMAALLKNSLVTNLLLNILLAMFLWTGSFFMNRMGQPPQVVEIAIPYFRIQVISLLPFMIFMTLKQFAEGAGNTAIAMVVTISANVINIGLNYVLIFGKLGAPALGLNGAGYASLAARIFMPVMMFLILINRKNFHPYLKLFPQVFLQFELVKRLTAVGWPIALQMLLEVVAFAMSGIMMGWIGEIPLAAHQIALGLASITFMIVTGISAGTTIRVSHQYSQKNFHDMFKAASASIHLVMVFMSFMALGFIIFRHYLPQLYTPNQEVIAMAAQLLIMAAIFQLFDGAQVVILGALRGLQMLKNPCFMPLLPILLSICRLVTYLLLFLIFGPSGIWMGFVAGLGVAAVLFYSRFRHQYRLLKQSYY